MPPFPRSSHGPRWLCYEKGWWRADPLNLRSLPGKLHTSLLPTSPLARTWSHAHTLLQKGLRNIVNSQCPCAQLKSRGSITIEEGENGFWGGTATGLWHSLRASRCRVGFWSEDHLVPLPVFLHLTSCPLLSMRPRPWALRSLVGRA